MQQLLLLQHPLLAHHLVQHQLAMPQVVEDRHEVGWVSVNQEGTSLILNIDIIT